MWVKGKYFLSKYFKKEGRGAGGWGVCWSQNRPRGDVTFAAMYSVSGLLGFPATTPGSPRSERGRGEGFGPAPKRFFMPPEPLFWPLADDSHNVFPSSGRLTTGLRPCEPAMLTICSPLLSPDSRNARASASAPKLHSDKGHGGTLRRRTSRMVWSALQFRFRGRRTWPQARQSADPRGGLGVRVKGTGLKEGKEGL